MALEARAPNLLGAMILDAVLASPASLIRFGELRIANGLLLAPVNSSFGLENIGPTRHKRFIHYSVLIFNDYASQSRDRFKLMIRLLVNNYLVIR